MVVCPYARRRENGLGARVAQVAGKRRGAERELIGRNRPVGSARGNHHHEQPEQSRAGYMTERTSATAIVAAVTLPAGQGRSARVSTRRGRVCSRSTASSTMRSLIAPKS